MRRFQKEETWLKKQFYGMIKNYERVDSVMEKLTVKVMEYELILADLKKNL